ncbi:MAG: acyl-CoA dehydrogenase family protein [Pseudomonadales bacterium]|nr:acyl-CoA dehydrogenase family protein [Pseudomonadales bacterium]MDA0761362.1 acyl-CoA dehydrogenase family protein [Pseudomonadota bacterium]MDA0958976.1 acyl-CoA dehydrogenase family protein [Pseudomonadota bacterium]
MNANLPIPETELIAAAARLVPELKTRSREIDQARQLPQDLAAGLASLGFYRLVVPPELGGLGVSPATFCRICETLAAGNGSTAWCVFIGATSQYLFGALPEDLLNDMLQDPNVITSGVFADSGTAQFESRDGNPGYRVNGHWRWGSGCRNAAWISGGIHEVDDKGERINRSPALTRVFFKPEEIQIQDNWHVSGMKGSGSSDYIAENVWVPAHRLAGNVEETPNASKPIYQFPKFALLGIPIGAICLGMARASLEEVIRVSKEKTPQGSRRPLALRPSLHIDMAKSDTALHAASSHFYACIEAGWQAAQTAPGSLEDRRMMRAATVHAVQTSIQVIDRMYSVMGGTSVYETSCLQQHFRDVHVASQHMMVGEPVMELAGRVLLGLDDEALGL